MTDLENVEQLLAQLQKNPAADISKYFPTASRKFRLLSKADRETCAQSFYESVKKNSKKEPLKFCYAEFLMALKYFMNEDHESAFHWLSGARKHFEEQKDEVGTGLCAMLIGGSYRTLGNFDLALKVLWEAFHILKKSGDYPVFLSACANSMANINYDLHNYDEALSMFNMAYEESEKTDDFYFNIYALQGLAKVKIKQNKPDEARGFLERALQLAKKNNHPMHVATSLTELANFYFNSGDLNEAEKLELQAMDIRDQNHFVLGAITNCVHLGEIYIKQARWEEGLQVLSKGLVMAEETRVKPKMSQVHFLLSEIYQSKKDLEKCLFHFKAFQKIHEQVEQEDSARKLTDAKLIFEAEQTRKENIIIKKQKEEIQQKNIELQQTIDQLTIAKVSRKAKALTLVIAIILFVLDDFILGFVLRRLPSDNYLLSLVVKMGIIFSLSPINRAIERYLLKKVIRKKREEAELLPLQTEISSA